MSSLSRSLAAQQLREVGADIRVIVIHPNYVQQHLIFVELLQDKNLVYVRLTGKSLTRAAIEQQLEQALEAQNGQKHLAGVRYLVLDECDDVDADAFDSFLTNLLAQMDGGILVLLTRQLPDALLSSAVLRAQTTFVPSDESLMLWDYAQRDSDQQPALLEVRALGTGRVLLNGRSVDSWDGVLPRSLFFYLVDKGMTTRNDIFETFWPNLSVREATNVFHVTKRKISEVLGVDLTMYWSGFYRISPDIDLSYDVVLFSKLLQDSAVQGAEKATETLHQTTWLYRDDFLASLESDWVTTRRRELRQGYSEALIGLAKAVDQQGKNSEALGLYLRALNTNPQREDVAHSAMRLYQAIGQPEDALAVYARLKDELQRNLGVAPARHLQELAREIERGGASPTGAR